MFIAQILVNSFIRGAELGLLSLGLTMVYGILKFANFSHTEFAIVGAYLAFLFSVTLKMNLFLSAALAAFLTGMLAMILDRAIFRRLRGAGAVTLMVTSFGLAIVLNNIVRAIWGPAPREYLIGLQRPLVFLGIRITPLQLGIIATALLIMITFHLLLNKTKLGKAMRATSDNPALAQASGIDTDRVILWVWFIGASFAAVGGILIGLETYVSPFLSAGIMIPMFCAAILGGIGNPYGAMLGALILGLAENFGLRFNFGNLINLGGLFQFVEDLYIPTGYKDAISFAILVLVLLVRPSGILGRRER